MSLWSCDLFNSCLLKTAVHVVLAHSLFHEITFNLSGGFVFSRSWINGLLIDWSCGFTILRLYDTYHHLLLLYWTYLCVFVYLFCICDILRLTSKFPRHGVHIDVHSNTSVIDRHCRDQFLHHHPWKTKIYWRPESIIPTQQAIQLTIPSLSLTWPDCYYRSGKAITPHMQK